MQSKVDNLVPLSAIMDQVGKELVNNILVRKGNQMLMDKSGVKLKPTAQAILGRNMERLRAKEDPRAIIADIKAQLLLL